jgi:hypothetical protein
MSRASQVAGPGLAPPVPGAARDEGEQPYAGLAFPFDAGPYDRFPSPLGAFSVDAAATRRRMIVAVLVAWVPLLVLSAMDGMALGPDPREAFLRDVAAHTRYLVALPLLILAERITLPKLGGVASHFATSGLVPPDELPRFVAVLSSTRRMLASPATAIVIVGLAYLATVTLAERVYPGTVSTWAAPITDDVRRNSLAGLWRALISQPLYVTIVGLWLWRAIVWGFFLYRVSRLELRLVASHPDRFGGLEFAVWSVRAFPPVAFALAVASAGNLATRLQLEQRSVLEFGHLIGLSVVVVIILFVGPLLALRGPLKRLYARGIFNYGELAADMGKKFEARWLRPGGDIPPEALEAPDFSAMTDAYQIVANVDAIRLVPVEPKSVGLLVLATVVPFVPLLLLEMPVDELLKFVANLLL